MHRSTLFHPGMAPCNDKHVVVKQVLKMPSRAEQDKLMAVYKKVDYVRKRRLLSSFDSEHRQVLWVNYLEQLDKIIKQYEIDKHPARVEARAMYEKIKFSWESKLFNPAKLFCIMHKTTAMLTIPATSLKFKICSHAFLQDEKWINKECDEMSLRNEKASDDQVKLSSAKVKLFDKLNFEHIKKLFLEDMQELYEIVKRMEKEKHLAYDEARKMYCYLETVNEQEEDYTSQFQPAELQKISHATVALMRAPPCSREFYQRSTEFVELMNDIKQQSSNSFMRSLVWFGCSLLGALVSLGALATCVALAPPIALAFVVPATFLALLASGIGGIIGNCHRGKSTEQSEMADRMHGLDVAMYESNGRKLR